MTIPTSPPLDYGSFTGPTEPPPNGGGPAAPQTPGYGPPVGGFSDVPTNPNGETVQLTPDEEAEIIAWVNRHYKRAKDSRNKQELIWYVNLAFYFGRQWAAPIHTQGQTRLTIPKAPYWRSRPVINKIRPTIRKEISKIVSTKPNAYVVPSTSEDQDLFAAQAAEQIWDSMYERLLFPKILRSAVFWSSICGTGFIKCWWNADKFDYYNSMNGDIDIIFENPFSVFVPDLAESDIEKQPFVIHSTLKPVEWAQLNFGDVLKAPLQATAKAQSVIDTGFLHLLGADVNPVDSVEIIEMWIKPGFFMKFPNGALITLVGNQLGQYIQQWPYQCHKYPFAKIDHVPTGGFYADSVITDLIPLQKEINRTHGQIIESKNRMAKPQIIAQQGSVDAAKITTEPGQVIFYKMGYNPPSPLPLTPLPNYVSEEMERLQIAYDDISGQHEVSRGTVPPGVTAATAISYLAEQDDSMLAGTIDSIEEATQKVAELCLNFVVQFWDEARMVKVTGTDESFSVVLMKGSDLTTNTDVRVEKGSALPTSRAAKQAFVMDLMKMGFIPPDKGLEVMEIGGVTKIYESIRVDTRQAQRENLKIQQLPEQVYSQWKQAEQVYGQMQKEQQMQQDMSGMVPPGTPAQVMGPDGQPLEPPPPPVPVNSWDNHPIHIEIHNRFRKSQTFEALPEFIKEAFEQHVQLHQMALGIMPGIGMPMGQPGMPPEAGGQPGMPPETAGQPPVGASNIEPPPGPEGVT